MTYELKRLSPEAVPAALAKAERYRLLNEPTEAESICLDILDVEPQNQEALVMLLLALTDQFGVGVSPARARAVLERLVDDYERAYYAGLIDERQAKAYLHRAGAGSTFAAYACLVDALESYQKAEAIHPPGNNDAVLRWNACARLLMRHPELVPETPGEPLLLE
jgi:hypothetical protein